VESEESVIYENRGALGGERQHFQLLPYLRSVLRLNQERRELFFRSIALQISE